MFWGLVLEPSKKYTQKVDQTFHISQAALDLKSCDQEPIQLVVEYENSNFVLATLSKRANIFQVPLDLIFKTGDQVSFRTIGNGKVHLSGYHVLEDLDSMMVNSEESDMEEVQESGEAKGKRKKLGSNTPGNKKLKLNDTNEDESEVEESDEEDEDDEEDENFLLKKMVMKKKKPNSSLSTMEDDDDDDDDLEEEEDDDDEDEEDDDDDGDVEMDDDDDDDMLELDSDEETTKTPKSENKKKPQTPNGLSSGMKGKDKSGQNLNKSKKESKPTTPGKEKKTPTSENKSGKGEKHLKSSDSDSTPNRKGGEGTKNGEKTPKTPKSEGSPQKKVLEGGVISEELKVGNGPVAKPGKMVTVFYTGTLQSNKKQFDAVQNGPGFKFRLGRNEVIKGWDIGLNGMKVGGKRKLTIPPHLAYGARGSLPLIPPNSTLVFTVELKGLS